MAKLPFMPIDVGGFIGDVMHLSAQEVGAYWMILCVTWRNNGKPLPDDDVRLARIARVSLNVWRTKVRPALAPMFDISSGCWRNEQLERIWGYALKRSENARAHGIKGGQARRAKKKRPEGTWYQEYLQSAAWREKRHQVWERCGGVCEECRREKMRDVHHLTYAHVGDEPLSDLAGLCGDCHEKAHQIKLDS